MGIALAAVVVLIVALGLSPIFIIPVAVVAVVVVVRPVFASLVGNSRRRRGDARTPTTKEASYEPVIDPSER